MFSFRNIRTRRRCCWLDSIYARSFSMHFQCSKLIHTLLLSFLLTSNDMWAFVFTTTAKFYVGVQHCAVVVLYASFSHVRIQNVCLCCTMRAPTTYHIERKVIYTIAAFCCLIYVSMSSFFFFFVGWMRLACDSLQNSCANAYAAHTHTLADDTLV